MTVQDDIVKRAEANHHDISGGPARAAKNIRRKIVNVVKAADDGAAATATVEHPIFKVPAHVANGIEVKAVHYTSDATAIAAAADHNATMTVSKRDGAGGSAAVVATYTSDVAGGAVTAWVPKALTLSATLANLQVPAGGILTFLISKAMNGVVVPAGSITIEYEEL